MNNHADVEIDFEPMDDLPLSDHIEWIEFRDTEIILDDVDVEPDNYDTQQGGLHFD
jgi:hypothetical protein